MGQEERGHPAQEWQRGAEHGTPARDARRTQRVVPGGPLMAAVAERPGPSQPAAPAVKPPETYTFRLWSGDSTGGGYKDYQVRVDEGMVVLDVIHRIQATQAGDLAVRWNCKAGKCGSCSAEINGKPRLMCMTRMDLFGPEQ